MRTVITTVGTSLLTNRDDRPWSGWSFRDPHPDPTTVAKWLATADLVAASAELHTWMRLKALEDGDRERIRLVHSDTGSGAFCAECLSAFAKSRGIESNLRKVAGLAYTDSHNFSRGLVNLVHVVSQEIRTGSALGEVVIAATGGFKAEIAVVNLVGALLGAPVYYIYEQFHELIRLEPLPIELAPEWLKTGSGGSLLRKLSHSDLVPEGEVISLLKADTRLEMLIETADIDDTQFVGLNLLGKLAAELLEAPVADWPESTDLEPQAKVRLENAGHHRPHGWSEAVAKLARSPFVRFIRYDSAAGSRQGVREAIDSDRDVFVVIADGTAVLGLRAETTAENSGQRARVISHLRGSLKM